MFKSDFIDAVANRTLKDNEEVKTIIDTALDIILEQLVAGETITLQGFGTFAVRTQASSTRRNPRTGEAMSVPEKKVPGFKAAKALKEVIK